MHSTFVPDQLLDRFGEYYNSEFVKKNMPWVRAVPFVKFVEFEMSKRSDLTRSGIA